MRDDVLAVGIVALVIGFVAYVYPEQANILGYVYTVGYPYRNLGTLLIVVGFIALIVGAAMSKPRSQATSPSSVSSFDNIPGYCVSCGQSLRRTDAFCPRCGKATGAT